MKIDQMINFKYQSRKKRVLIYLITKFGTKIFYLIFLKIEEIEKKKKKRRNEPLNCYHIIRLVLAK